MTLNLASNYFTLLTTYIEDFLQVKPSKLFTPEETLNTRDKNQKKFTTPFKLPGAE